MSEPTFDELLQRAVRGDAHAFQVLVAQIDAAEQAMPGLCEAIESAIVECVPVRAYRETLELAVDWALETRVLDLLRPLVDIALTARCEPYGETIDAVLGKENLLRIAAVLEELADEGDHAAGRELQRIRRHLEL